MHLHTYKLFSPPHNSLGTRHGLDVVYNVLLPVHAYVRALTLNPSVILCDGGSVLLLSAILRDGGSVLLLSAILRDGGSVLLLSASMSTSHRHSSALSSRTSTPTLSSVHCVGTLLPYSCIADMAVGKKYVSIP